ncbi:transposable element gene [Prunus dulcis]|uniref:Transposable element protein n=1 Tax=Prunus dulcis TaxID=3755 RepID=A0A5H2Y1L0_PRUDU|nr:transposable element gene [Prunus dulcis]
MMFKRDVLIAQVYVDDIVVGSTSDLHVQEFIHVMISEFEMSLVGELHYFLGLQIKQSHDGIFVSQSKYAKNLVKKFGLEAAKSARTPMSTSAKIHRDLHGKKSILKLLLVFEIALVDKSSYAHANCG